MKKRLLIMVLSVVIILFGILFIKSLNEKEMVVTALGDSLAYGVGDTNDNGYLGDVKERYEADTGRTLIVENFGVPNDTSTDLLHRLENKRITKSAMRSNFVLINIGTNDFLKSTDKLTTFNKPELMKNEEIYKNNLNKALNIIQDENKQKPIYILGIYNPKVEGTNDSHINEAIQSWNQTTKQVTESRSNVAFIPTNDIFQSKNKKEYFSDVLHPNKKGYHLIAKRVHDTLTINSNYQ
ncbi:hypothetical protein KUV80_03965 [Fictibacillus nanhaiensis]|uniref:DUF459 domain-containing protein n=1 Tax=Fictibacillus nanhaiensis TaxID=742169 RepID=UPI001C96DD88|nr:GDSL-type esterase/lipase family protein [Fictibacillus nanhaiensis]MBY6035790.1 hypothetical protein [Fictibacillus nanhaiensis]